MYPTSSHLVLFYTIFVKRLGTVVLTSGLTPHPHILSLQLHLPLVEAIQHQHTYAMLSCNIYPHYSAGLYTGFLLTGANLEYVKKRGGRGCS